MKKYTLTIMLVPLIFFLGALFTLERKWPLQAREESPAIHAADQVTEKISAASYWTAGLKIHNFSYREQGSKRIGDGQFYEGPHVAEAEFSYRIYQNPEGIVRRELTSSSIKPGIGIGRDFQLIDYASGILLAFDKSNPVAVRFRLESLQKDPFMPSSKDLGRMEILGYQCKGVENRLEDSRNNLTEIRQTWVAIEGGFKEPLLENSKTVRADGQLLSISMKTVTYLEKAQQLEPSLFHLPPGYKVLEQSEGTTKSDRSR